MILSFVKSPQSYFIKQLQMVIYSGKKYHNKKMNIGKIVHIVQNVLKCYITPKIRDIQYFIFCVNTYYLSEVKHCYENRKKICPNPNRAFIAGQKKLEVKTKT